jgi:hypothetical protein
MPKHTPFLNDLPRWMRYRECELSVFWFIRGVQTALPATYDKRALELYASVHGLSEDEFPIDSWIVKLSRMRAEFEDYKGRIIK